tara:strand:- start:6166 stop:9291 length:3126 start_codon:yes stop_codon:yes gene_type:complete
MAISVGEGYSLLGQGFAKAAQGNLSEQRKMMKEAQRRQLVTAALTPVAQGVGQFATDLISAPFKDAASNFYNRGAGKGLNANRKAYRSLEKQAKDRMSEINKQGKYNYFKSISDEAYLAYDAKSRSDLGEDFKSHAAYSEGLVELPSLIRQQQDKEYGEAVTEYNSYLDSPTQAQVSAAIKKYSPYATNPASWLYKKGKQIITGQDSAEIEEKALNRLQTHLASYGMDLSDESLAKLREVNRTGSDAYFSVDTINNMSQFQTTEYKTALQNHRDNLDLQTSVFNGDNGALQTLWFEIKEKSGGKQPTAPQMNRAVSNKMYEVFRTDLKDEQQDFRTYVNSSSQISDVLKERISTLKFKTEDAKTKYLNKIADGAFVVAKRIHQNDLLKGKEVVFGEKEKLEYSGSIRRIAKHLILNNVQLDTIKEVSWGNDPALTVIDPSVLRSLQSSADSSDSSGNGGSPANGSAQLQPRSSVATVSPQVYPVNLATPTSKGNVALASQVRQGLKNILGSDLLLGDKQQEWNKMQTKIGSNMVKSQGGDPANSKVRIMYPPDIQEMIDALEEGPEELEESFQDVQARNREFLLSPFRLSGAEIQARKRAKLGLPEEGGFRLFEATTKSPEEMERINRERQQAITDYENRSSSEAFADIESGRDVREPLQNARSLFETTPKSDEEIKRIRSEKAQAITDYENRSSSEAFADIESGRDIVDPKLQVARETYKSNLREPFQNISSLLETTPKSPERIAEIRKQRSAAIAEYEANKEPDVDSGPSILDSVIDFLVPKAEASRELKAEVTSRGTSISRAAKRNQDSEMSRWEDKGTIKVSNVYNDGSVVEVPTKNPIRFIQNNIDTPMEAVAIYYEALKSHNSERPSAATYQMKPLTQAMTWAYEAFPDQLPNLERMYFNRVKNKESGRSLLKLIESPSNEKEIKAYTAKVSKMSDSEKEKEFDKQLKIARKIRIETDSDLAANAIAYRKLQSIFGEEDNRVIGKEGSTVSSKVDQYYNYLLPTKSEDYDLITKVYEQVLADVNPPAAFSLLAQR